MDVTSTNGSAAALAEPDLAALALDRSGTGIDRLLATAREALDMEVAFVSEFAGGDEVFRTVSGEGRPFEIEEGESIPLEETICSRVADSRAPTVIPDTRREEAVSELPRVEGAGIGCYVGVPIRLSDGRTYGTFCCVARAADPSLAERDVAFMHVFARFVADQIERDELAAAKQRLEVAATGVEALLSALAARDGYTADHSTAVVSLSVAVARRVGLSEEEVAAVEQVALLHDVGKIGVPDSVLRKPSPLDAEEWEVMRTHPVTGAGIVASVQSLTHLERAVRAEHERWDGGGYPDGLAGTDIPVASRIVLVCDAYHAMTSDRPYRRALAPDAARAELLRHRGTQFCPDTVDAVLAVLATAPAP